MNDRVIERRIRNNKIRRTRQLRRRISISVFSIVLAAFLATWGFSVSSSAKDGSEAIEMKYYTSITVSGGDTLWSIANEYMGEHYKSADQYIAEVMSMNGLSDETICAGQHLIIPYFSADYLK